MRWRRVYREYCNCVCVDLVVRSVSDRILCVLCYVVCDMGGPKLHTRRMIWFTTSDTASEPARKPSTHTTCRCHIVCRTQVTLSHNFQNTRVLVAIPPDTHTCDFIVMWVYGFGAGSHLSTKETMQSILCDDIFDLFSTTSLKRTAPTKCVYRSCQALGRIQHFHERDTVRFYNLNIFDKENSIRKLRWRH